MLVKDLLEKISQNRFSNTKLIYHNNVDNSIIKEVKYQSFSDFLLYDNFINETLISWYSEYKNFDNIVNIFIIPTQENEEEEEEIPNE